MQDMKEKKGAAAPEEKKEKKSIGREIFEWVMVFVAAAAIAFVVRTFIFEPVRVDGSSMLNTLTNGDFMIATKFDYLLGQPQRFDVVICDYPNTNDHKYRVKRIIGLPGETVQLVAGELYINGEHVEQGYDFGSVTEYAGPYEVKEGEYFVLGDNRNNSKDSRAVGALPRKMIRGHVQCVVFPFGHAKIVNNR